MIAVKYKGIQLICVHLLASMKMLHGVVLLLGITLCSARDTLTPTQPLADNETLISSGGGFALGFFSPGSSKNRYIGMWFNKVPERKIVWVANRASPVVNSTGLLSVTANGTMVITDRKSNAIVWSAGTSSLTGPVVQLLETGNFVVKEDDDDKNYAWQSFDHPTDCMLAGMKLGMNWTTGLSHTLRAWKTDNDPSDGEYYMAMEADTVIYLYSSTGKIWRSGPADGNNMRSSGLDYSYVDNSQETALIFKQDDKPIVLMASSSGKAQLVAWISDSGKWDILWEEPTNMCDNMGHCGHNGICDINASPVCKCLPGYVPKNTSEWSTEVWAGGCVRETGPDCRNGTDGFAVISEAKLPQLPSLLRAFGYSLDQCRLACLNNCSCTAFAIDGGEYGCVIWVTDLLFDVVHIHGFQQDLFVRVSSAYLASSIQPHKSKHTTVAIVVSLLLGTLLITACVACFLWKRRARKRAVSGATKSSIAESKEICGDIDIPLFDFSTIEAATNYFSYENELGQGGFGTVYKGKLVDDQEIAVKRLATTSLQGTDEFKNEVKLIAKLQHINLVRLLGCCVQGEERMLVYEYMPNKSLDAFLFDKEKGALLDWQARYKIIIGIARGLLYLHHDSLFRIIHRDLKASNILLDNGMNPKISDFGMARLFGGDETDFNTRKIVGTYGYMSPEYAMEGIFSLKSDVFSFGVLILEIISGKKNKGANASFPYLNLVAQAWNLWTVGECFKLVDESMNRSFLENDVLRCIMVGLLCVQEDPEERPLMSSVVVMLGADVTSLPEPKQPGFAVRIGKYEPDKTSSKQDSSASTELTITLDGR